MITMLLAWINARYKHDYESLFIGTFFLDYIIIKALVEALTNNPIN
jgi:hypothetical protein